MTISTERLKHSMDICSNSTHCWNSEQLYFMLLYFTIEIIYLHVCVVAAKQIPEFETFDHIWQEINMFQSVFHHSFIQKSRQKQGLWRLWRDMSTNKLPILERAHLIVSGADVILPGVHLIWTLSYFCSIAHVSIGAPVVRLHLLWLKAQRTSRSRSFPFLMYEGKSLHWCGDACVTAFTKCQWSLIREYPPLSH